MRAGVALLAGAAVAYLGAVVLGEYAMTLGTGVAAGVVVPLLVDEVVATAGRARGRAWPHLAAGVLGGAGVAVGVWFTTGRGLEPWPAAGTVAVAVAVAWPCCRAAVAARAGGARAQALSQGTDAGRGGADGRGGAAS